MEYAITNDRDYFDAYEGFKISYHTEHVPNSFFIRSTRLLFEEDINQFKMEVVEWKNEKALFPVNGSSELPTDVFAAVFFMISRYEEYLPHTHDRYNRFKVQQSLAYRHQFIEIPLVDIWIRNFGLELQSRFPELYLPPVNFKIVPTIDIDNAYAWKYRGYPRNFLSVANSLLNLKFKDFSHKISVLAGLKEDPFDSYEKQQKIHARLSLNPKYFVLLGDLSRYDTNLSHNNKQMVRLIQSLDQKGKWVLILLLFQTRKLNF